LIFFLPKKETPVTITQFIVVDGLTIAQLTYDILNTGAHDNRTSHSGPSHDGGVVPPAPPRVELISIRRQSASPDTTYAPLPASHAVSAASGTGTGMSTAGVPSSASPSPSTSSSASPPESSSSLPAVSAVAAHHQHQPHSVVGMNVKPAGSAAYAMSQTGADTIGGAGYLPGSTTTYGQTLSAGVSHHQSHHAHHPQYPHHPHQQQQQQHHKTLSGSNLGTGGVYYPGDAATGICTNNNNNSTTVPVRGGGVPTERMIASGLLPPPNPNFNIPPQATHSSGSSSSGSGLGLGLGLGNNSSSSSTLSGALTPSLPYHHHGSGGSGGHRVSTNSKLTSSSYSDPASGHPMMFL
jgi:hypothetical protein